MSGVAFLVDQQLAVRRNASLLGVPMAGNWSCRRAVGLHGEYLRPTVADGLEEERAPVRRLSDHTVTRLRPGIGAVDRHAELHVALRAHADEQDATVFRPPCHIV